MMVNSSNHVVIAGAGIVGSVQSLLLARSGFDVTLVEARQTVPDAGGLNVRTVALSCRSRQLLENSGLWPESLGCAIREVHASERGGFGSVRLTANDLDVDTLGYVIANAELEASLMQQIKDQPNIDFVCPGKATLVANSDHDVALQIGSRKLTAALLVAADGSHSALRDSLGIAASNKDYGQFATVANIRCQRPHQHIAYERFTEYGPLAMLPFGDRQMAMVYSATRECTDHLRGLTDTEFLASIQRSFGGKLGRLQSVGSRVVFPLQLIVSSAQTLGCSVLIGNAARTIHPVAGQGLNLALRDVFELAAQISPGQPIAAALDRFSISRRADQQQVISQTDRLARVFLKQPRLIDKPFSLLRSTAMVMLDGIPAFRKRFGAANAGLRLPSDNSGLLRH